MPIAVPDTGSLRGDMDAIVSGLPDFDDAMRSLMTLFAGLATAASRDPALRSELSGTIMDRSRRTLREVLDRAVERGEIPADRDLDLIADVLIGMNVLQVVLGGVPDRAFVQRVLREIIYPLVTT